MVTADDKSTHPAEAVDPKRFRAQATGIGQSMKASERTGAMRAARVVAAMPERQRAAVPVSEGYPLGGEAL